MKLANKLLKIVFVIGLLCIPIAVQAFVVSGGPSSIEYVVDASNADQGVIGNGKTIKAYVDTIGTSKNAVIKLNHTSTGNTTTYTLTTGETISSNICVIIQEGAILSDGGGAADLTINGSFPQNPGQKCFDWTGSGKVDFGVGSIKEDYPQWWGIDGTADNIEIDKAIAAYSTTKLVYAIYNIASTITISSNNKNLIGEEGHRPIINNAISGGASDAIIFTTATPDDSALFGSGCSIQNILITAATDQTAGVALKVIKHTGFRIENFVTMKHPFGIDLYGTRSLDAQKFRLYYTAAGRVVGSSLLRIGAQANSDSSYTTPWTSNFTDFIFGGNHAIDYGIEVNSGDGLTFADGYVSSNYQSLVRLKCTVANGENIAMIYFDNIYFDGVYSTISGIYFEEDSLSPASSITAINFSNCFIGQANESGMYIDKNSVGSVNIIGIQFANVDTAGLKVDSSDAEVIVSGCSFRNCRTDADSGAIIDLSGSSLVSISGCNIVNTSPVAAWGIIFSGTHNAAAVTGCTFRNCTPGDVGFTSPTFNNQLKIVGNVTNNAAGVPERIGEHAIFIGSADGSASQPKFLSGTGTPEGNVGAVVGSIYMRDDGGANTSVYVKESGIGNTGWIAK